MANVRKVRKKRVAPIRSSDRQTLGERIRWLRATMRPPMTLKQLADITGIKITSLSALENGDMKKVNVELDTLRRIAHGLDVKIFINLKKKPYPLSEECQPLGHDLPPIVRPKRKWTERGHRLAEEYGSYPWKNYPRRKRRKRPTKTSDTPGSEKPPLATLFE